MVFEGPVAKKGCRGGDGDWNKIKEKFPGKPWKAIYGKYEANIKEMKGNQQEDEENRGKMKGNEPIWRKHNGIQRIHKGNMKELYRKYKGKRKGNNNMKEVQRKHKGNEAK